MNEWIEWTGGKCPVSGDDEVEIQFRFGQIATFRASDLRWEHATPQNGLHAHYDTIRYRLAPASAGAGKGIAVCADCRRLYDHKVGCPCWRHDHAAPQGAEVASPLTASTGIRSSRLMSESENGSNPGRPPVGAAPRPARDPRFRLLSYPTAHKPRLLSGFPARAYWREK